MGGVFTTIIRNNQFIPSFIRGTITNSQSKEFYLKFEKICNTHTKDILNHLKFIRLEVPQEKYKFGVGKHYYEFFKNMVERNSQEYVLHESNNISKASIYNHYGLQRIESEIIKIVIYDNEFYELIISAMFFSDKTTNDEKKKVFLEFVKDLLKTVNIHNLDELNSDSKFNETDLRLNEFLENLDQSEKILSSFLTKGINQFLNSQRYNKAIEIFILTHNQKIVREYKIISNELKKISFNILTELRNNKKFYFPSLLIEILSGGTIVGKVFDHCNSKISHILSAMKKEIFSYDITEIRISFKKNIINLLKFMNSLLENYKQEELNIIIQNIKDIISLFEKEEFQSETIPLKLKVIKEFFDKNDHYKFRHYERIKKLD